MKVEASKREIITVKDIQGAYLQFYPCIMQYLWDMKTVQCLANLEISIYKAFPDKEEMQKYVNELESYIRDTYNNEEDVNAADFKKTFEHLKSYIEQYEDIGYDIYHVEPIINMDNVEDKVTDEPTEKKTISVGKIVTK